MVENIYNNASGEMMSYQTEGRKAPKNVRQIGYFTGSFRIYIEDYVHTFTRWLAEQDYSGHCAAVLVGEFAKSEHTRDVYAYGCIIMENVCNDAKIEITGDTWGSIYESIKEYFPDGEIVGWFYGGTNFVETEKEMLRQVHLDHFAGTDRVLLLYDFLEKEEELYRYEDGDLTKQSGYYIYYEKNEEMQSYMIDKKQGKEQVEEVEDKAVRQMRARFAPQRKDSEYSAGTMENDQRAQRRGSDRFFYVSGIVVTAVTIMVGAAVLHNEERLAGFEQTLNQMLHITDGENKESDEAGKTEQMAQSGGNIFEEPLTQETFGNGSAKDAEMGEGNEKNVKDMEKEANEKSSGQVSTDPTGEPESEQGLTDLEQQPEITEESEPTQDIPTVTEAPISSDETNPAEAKDAESKETENITEGEAEVSGSDAEEVQESSGNLLDTSSYQYYIVKPGDTLAGICKKLYGNMEYMQHIKELNQITNEDLIYVDQELLVP